MKIKNQNTIKNTTKLYTQTETCTQEKEKKPMGSIFYWRTTYYSIAWGLPRSANDISEWYLIEKKKKKRFTHFKYYFQIASWLDLGLCAHPTFTVMGFYVVLTCKELHMYQSIYNSCVYLSCVWKIFFACSHPPLLSLLLQYHCLLFCADTCTLRRGVWYRLLI